MKEDVAAAFITSVDQFVDFVIDRFGSLVAVVSLFGDERRLQEPTAERLSISEMSHFLAHAKSRDHLPCELRCSFQVICASCGDFAMIGDLFGSTAAKHDDK